MKDFDNTFGTNMSEQEFLQPEPVTMTDEELGMSYNDATRELSNGSVQIYGLDDSHSPTVPDLMRPISGGMATDDPNVTVFPLGGGAPPSYNGAPPRLMPPSGSMDRMDSPFGGPIQQPLTPPAGLPDTYMPAAPQSYIPATTDQRVSKIYFNHGSDRVNNTGLKVVDYVAQSSRGPIAVEGHASTAAEVSDPVLRRIVNLKMSMERAYAVSKALIQKGVPAENITTKAFGDTIPAMPVAGVSSDAINRRVEIINKGNTYSSNDYSAVYMPEPSVVRY